jgi:trans-aconitate methyltransferase
MPWVPELYNRFQAERAVPFEDLVSLVKIRSGRMAAHFSATVY